MGQQLALLVGQLSHSPGGGYRCAVNRALKGPGSLPHALWRGVCEPGRHPAGKQLLLYRATALLSSPVSFLHFSNVHLLLREPELLGRKSPITFILGLQLHEASCLLPSGSCFRSPGGCRGRWSGPISWGSKMRSSWVDISRAPSMSPIPRVTQLASGP